MEVDNAVCSLDENSFATLMLFSGFLLDVKSVFGAVAMKYVKVV